MFASGIALDLMCALRNDWYCLYVPVNAVPFAL
jgi:hypothetical protein